MAPLQSAALQRVRKFLAGFVVLALSIAIPASISASWFIYALWIAIGLAVVLLLFLSESLQRLLPYRFERKNPQLEEVIGRVMRQYLLRKDLQEAYRNLLDTKNPTPAELRAFADNLAQRLRDDGHAVKAKRVEVELPDNAPASDVESRRRALDNELLAVLIWDNYS